MQLLSGSKTTLKKVKLWAKLLGLVWKGYIERECDHGDVESKETLDGLIVGMVLWAAMGET
jgi:hypothetical protein